jgi:hypothetical protein
VSRRREDIDNGIWSDPEFHALTPAAKLLYLWSFTNTRCGMAGLYKLPQQTAAFELGITPQRERDAFAELGRARFAYYHDGVLFVRSRVKHIRTNSEQITKSIVRDVELIAEGHPLRQMFAAEYASSWLAKAIDKYSLDRAILVRLDRGSGEVLGQGQGPGQGLGPGQVGETELYRESEFRAQSADLENGRLSVFGSTQYRTRRDSRRLGIELRPEEPGA